MGLPEKFENRMRELWGDEEFERYRECLGEKVYKAVRVNTLKVSVGDFIEIAPWKLERVPWTENGFYYEDREEKGSGNFFSELPSKHPYYYAGLYYLQEPSAMAPAQLLPIEPGDRVLDICAAPGGKSTELGARLKGKGVLVCNDISASRIKALLKNIELFGIKNSIILNETPERLLKHFGEYFDKILIDAPCSGEGMFRKEPEMMKSWEEKGEDFYVKLQDEILPYAVKMLKPGGYLLYSTCTYNPDEDEMQVKKLLDEGFDIVDIRENPLVREELEKGRLDCGHPEWILKKYEDGSGNIGRYTDEKEDTDARIKCCLRFFPHRLKGEGHFAALLRKKNIETGDKEEQIKEYSEITCGNDKEKKTKKNTEKSNIVPKSVKFPLCSLDFFSKVRGLRNKETDEKCLDKVITEDFDLVMGKENLYLIPRDFPDLTGLHVVRSGLLLGTVKNYNRSTFEPAQAFAMVLDGESFTDVVSLKSDDERCVRYLKGETIEIDNDRTGWQLVTIDGFPLGFGRAQGGKLKNKYSKGWRMM